MNIANNLTSVNIATQINEPANDTVKESFSVTVPMDEHIIDYSTSITSETMYSRELTLDEYIAIMDKPNGDITIEESMAMLKFRETEEFDTYMKQESLRRGELRQTEAVFTIGDEHILFKEESTSATDGVARYMVSGDPDKTLENLYKAFGENNVETEFYTKETSPTNAEMFERFQGVSYYHHVMSGWRLGQS